MAKIQTETLTVTFSRLVRDGDNSSAVVGEEIRQALEQVAQELAGAAVIVEVEVLRD